MADCIAGGNGEEWRPIVGYEGWYEVSDQGRVRRVKPSGQSRTPGGILAPSLSSHGYRVVALYTGSNASARRRYVHDLVAGAFLGPRPAGLTVNHKDGVKTRNRPDNLEYISRGDNVRHAYAIGINRNAVLTPEQVAEAKVLKRSMTFPALAAHFGVSYNTVFRAVHGRTYRHLNP